MATVHQGHADEIYGNKESRAIAPAPHFNYETYYKHQEKQPIHTNPLLQYLSDTELRYRNDNLYETEIYRLPRRTDILNRYISMNPNFEPLNRVYEPNLTNIEKQRYRRCVEQQEQRLHRIRKKFDFQTNDGHNSHYFLTGARYNRFDTVDSKILMKYGTFVNRNNPEQVDIKASHFKKFREILQSQHRSSSGGGDTARKDHSYELNGDKGHEEDLEDLTNRYERSSSRQSNLKPTNFGRRTKLPKINDPDRYIDAGSQMPERKRTRRSLDRAISSSSTHRSSRHRRQSQHQQQQQQQQLLQQQQSPAQQSSVSYVANKVSFSLVDESNPPPSMVSTKQHEDEYGLIAANDNDRRYHQQHTIPHESIDDDEEQEQEQEQEQNQDQDQEQEQEHEQEDEHDEDEDGSEKNNEEHDPIVIEQLRQQATVLISNILVSAFDQISMTPKE